MTPRFFTLFVLLFALMVFGEWFLFFRGFDFSTWPASNWVILVLALAGEAVAAAVVTRTIDHALPAPVNQTLPTAVKSSRRSKR